MAKTLIIIIFILLSNIACATTKLAPFGKEKDLQLEEEESRLWKWAVKEQKFLDKSGYIYEDPFLSAYVNEVAWKIIPEECKEKGLSFQVKIIKNPLLNAFAFPNGFIYIHTGILAKMENEAQLATLLGHEMTHVINRHAVQEFKNLKGKASLLVTVRVAALSLGVCGSIVNKLGRLGVMASITGYSRELEREADQIGFNLIVKAGYDPKESLKLFEHLKREVEEQKIKEPFFFGTHPRLKERIESYNHLIKTCHVKDKCEKGTERFIEKILPLILDNGMLDLSMGRFSSAQKSFEKVLNKEPHNAIAHYYLAEVYRQRCEEGDIERAEKEYLLATQFDPHYPASYKGLGLIYYKQGEKEQAIKHFERYLFLAPQTKDSGYIKQYLQSLQNN